MTKFYMVEIFFDMSVHPIEKQALGTAFLVHDWDFFFTGENYHDPKPWQHSERL